MGMKVGGKKGGPMADINVTPLVDVVLVLLIIFMVITHLLGSGVDVPLPVAKTGTEVRDGGQHLVVSIKAGEVRNIVVPEGMKVPRTMPEIFVDISRTEPDALIDDINEAYQEKPDRSLLVKGDKNLTWRDVREVMDIIHSGGMTTMLLAVEGDKGTD
jgi:biopolymer transport protein ExbD